MKTSKMVYQELKKLKLKKKINLLRADKHFYNSLSGKSMF